MRTWLVLHCRATSDVVLDADVMFALADRSGHTILQVFVSRVAVSVRAWDIVCACACVDVVDYTDVAPPVAKGIVWARVPDGGATADVVLGADEVFTVPNEALDAGVDFFVLWIAVPAWGTFNGNATRDMAPRHDVRLALAQAAVLRLEMPVCSKSVAHSSTTLHMVLHGNVVAAAMADASRQAALKVHVLARGWSTSWVAVDGRRAEVVLRRLTPPTRSSGTQNSGDVSRRSSEARPLRFAKHFQVP